jgi:hypothetical protein
VSWLSSPGGGRVFALADWALGAARLVTLTVTAPDGRTKACAADRICRLGR